MAALQKLWFSASVDRQCSEMCISLLALKQLRRKGLLAPLTVPRSRHDTIAATETRVAVDNALTGFLGRFLGHFRW
ncbi:hypothetical protein ACFVJ3_40740 [Rhodococcus sp. NPDC127593]|uniref:hypothetical protein n=2 Tax=unclassified Rhodococcus (in: high G+C Gram-positive bacteria) TaxID=192944 RepID=UPI00362A7E43